ncbi:hypothetical protein TNCV_1477401 [Trichonephila clavipes]|nr:hypothetical protein TNCV_1477401 [Trichonephila clavipes]
MVRSKSDISFTHFPTEVPHSKRMSETARSSGHFPDHTNPFRGQMGLHRLSTAHLESNGAILESPTPLETFSARLGWFSKVVCELQLISPEWPKSIRIRSGNLIGKSIQEISSLSRHSLTRWNSMYFMLSSIKIKPDLIAPKKRPT